MHDEAEDRLRAGLVAGRDDAFAALYDCYGRSLYRVASTLLRSRHDAEDAVQEVFLGVVRSRTGIAKVESLRAYLFSALRHAVTRLASRQKPSASLGDEKAAAEIGLDPDLSAALERGLASLPEEQREVLSLKIDGELTFAEIASVLEISPNTAASRYRYALEKLRSVVEAEAHGPKTATTRTS